MSYSLANKVAIVTGASRQIGIGAAIARALAEAGVHIFITYYRSYDAQMSWGSEPTDVDKLLAELQGMGVSVAGMELDLAQIESPSLLFDKATAVLGPVDILINNATYSVNAGIETLTAASLDRHYAVNLRGMALLCVEFVKRFTGRENGRIINLTSGQGTNPMPDELPYVATKGAVEAFTTSLSASVAKHGITVNAVDPGITDTGWISDEFRQTLLTQAPMGRLGQPQDAARLIRFLASPEANWITGQIIRSRGGL